MKKDGKSKKRKVSSGNAVKAPTMRATSKLTLPVYSGPSTLPLLDPNFSWEKFERFTKQLIELIFKNHEVKLFGVKGQKQHGIDLVAQDKDGNHFFAQNKRYKNFTVAHFKKAKSELKLNGKTILLLACEASAELRLEVMGDPLWDVWDLNDISDKVFQLESSDRKEIVKRNFGFEWARAFSDYNEFSSIVSPIDYYRNLFDPKKLFNHTIPFIGREEELAKLKKFVGSNYHALVLNAAGGVGKSRLLWEFSKECPHLGWSILFIKEGMTPLSDHFQTIKSNKVIFVFDDAHRFDVTPYLTFIYSLKNTKFKIIFSTRPQGCDKLKLSLQRNNFESSEIQDFEVKRFTQAEARVLVLKLLPQIDSSYVWPLANLFADSTLIGVLACNLIKRKTFSLASLSNEVDVKDRILSGFTDELSGKIDSKLSNDFIQKVLSYISALSPVGYESMKIDPQFVSATEEKENEVDECIADLLHAGLLIERGGQIRISPDVLSDCILERVCYLKNGVPSNYFNTLFEKVVGKPRNNLLKNISELDWRKKNAELTSSVLLDGFWSQFKKDSSADLDVISERLETVKSVAYYQPIESYEALLHAIDSLSKISHEGRDYRFSSSISSIVDICRDIIFAGYNVEELMMTLWDLGKGDTRNLNPNPEHPIRRLGDLCTYERNFPIALYEKTLSGLRGIINKYDSSRDHHEPISMLGGFLAKTSSSTFSEGHTITISPFHVSFENTKHIRSQVFEILKNLALSADLKVAYLAVKEISEAATPPHGMMGLETPRKQLQVWHSEITHAINLLVEIYKKTPHSLIKVHVKNNLNQKIRWNKKSRYKSIISSFLEKNPFTIEELKYVPFAFWSYNDLLVARDFKDYSKTQALEQEAYEKITKEIVLKLKTPKKILKYTEDVVSELLLVNDSVNSWRFSLVLADLVDCERMCESILDNNSNKIENDFAVFLKKVSTGDLTNAIQLVIRSLALKNETILRSIAGSFWWDFQDNYSNKDVLNLYDKLFKHDLDSVRLSSIIGIRYLVNCGNKPMAIKILLDTEFTSTTLACAVFDLLNPYCIKFEDLSNDQLSLILHKLKDIEDLSDHGIGEFIAECSKRIPVELFDFLLYRIEAKRDYQGRFVPMPHLGFGKIGLSLSEAEIQNIFDKLVVSMRKEDSDTFWLPNLFYDISRNHFEFAFSYITNLIKSDDFVTVGIGTQLLRKYNNSLVFARQDWVRELLSHGKSKGTQFYDEIRYSLFRLAIPTSKSGTAGHPMPQDVALVENSTAAIAKATLDYERKFFAELKEHGEREIAETIKRNQKYLDE